MIYVLDANVFIEAHRRYYSLDICPGFWDSISHLCQQPRLLSIDKVRDEINEGDKLYDWIEQAPDTLFKSTKDEDVAKSFGELMTWVQAQEQFFQEAKAEFASVADGWVIAYAKAHGYSVVTHEVLNKDIRKKVPIPNVCDQFHVPHVDTFDMLRALEVKFGWQAI